MRAHFEAYRSLYLAKANHSMRIRLSCRSCAIICQEYDEDLKSAVRPCWREGIRVNQLIDVLAKFASMLSRFRSRKIAAYFGSRENLGTESFRLTLA